MKLSPQDLLKLERAAHRRETAILKRDVLAAELAHASQSAELARRAFEVVCMEVGLDPSRSFEVRDDGEVVYNDPQS